MDLAGGEVMFAATGVTAGTMLKAYAGSEVEPRPILWLCGPNPGRFVMLRLSIILGGKQGSTGRRITVAPNTSDPLVLGVNASFSGALAPAALRCSLGSRVSTAT